MEEIVVDCETVVSKEMKIISERRRMSEQSTCILHVACTHTKICRLNKKLVVKTINGFVKSEVTPIR
jgi:mRNA degradation ribonuclease J1/J2